MTLWQDTTYSAGLQFNKSNTEGAVVEVNGLLVGKGRSLGKNGVARRRFVVNIYRRCRQEKKKEHLPILVYYYP